MTEIIRILVVEDDDDQLELYEDKASELSDETLSFALVSKQSAQAAKAELLSNEFDGAIVDLNLSPGNPHEASGNEILVEITARHRFPVLVVSGNLKNLDQRVQASGFLKTFGRDTSNDVIFDYLLKMYKTGITRILGGRGLLEHQLGEIFWRHLAYGFDSWDAGGRDSEKTLLRYVVTHLTEYLDLPSGGVNDYYHEAEFYVLPPIRKHIATGDIVSNTEGRFIVLSPACDIAVRDIVKERPVINAKNVVLAPIFAISREDFLNRGLIKDGDNGEARNKILEQIFKSQNPKYAALPGYRNIDAGVIDLQNIVTWTLDDFLSAKREATVAGGFIKDIQSRLAAYYGRQGQPDLDKKELLSKYKSKLAPQNQQAGKPT